MKNKKLLLLRYFILIILIFSIISQENANINAFGIILILLLIINNQMRIFTLENRKRLFCLSIILEWVLSFIIYKNYGGFLIFYFIISIIDGTILLENKFSILFNIFTIFIMIFMSKSLDTDILIYNISILGIISILSLYIKDEYLRIIKAEDLYYRLKISEENLIKANKDLEIYADSIKELSILRERNRISREIHDSVGHSLSTIIIQLGAIEKLQRKMGN